MWSIAPRKYDLIPRGQPDLPPVAVARNERTSFTFRKVRSSEKPCECNFPNLCDSRFSRNPPAQLSLADREASKLEKMHVHEVIFGIRNYVNLLVIPLAVDILVEILNIFSALIGLICVVYITYKLTVVWIGQLRNIVPLVSCFGNDRMRRRHSLNISITRALWLIKNKPYFYLYVLYLIIKFVGNHR